MPLHTPHQVAFAEWHAANLDRVEVLWDDPQYRDREIRLVLNRFYPCIVATVDRDRCSVAVEWDLQDWGTLYAAEVDVQRPDGASYECVLKPLKNREQYLRIEDVWVAHLYEPLASWIEYNIMPKPMLHLCERGLSKWAKLLYQEPAPKDVLVTLHGGHPTDPRRRCFVSGDWS